MTFVHHLRSCENSGASGETSSMGSQDKTKQNKTKTKQNRTTKWTVLFLDRYSKELKAGSQRDICTPYLTYSITQR